MQVKKQQLELDMKQWIGSKLGKGYTKSVYCHPVHLTYMQSAECIMQNARLDEVQARIRLLADDTILMAERKEELKKILMKVKEESEKVGLKLNIKKSKTMASKTSWQIDGETMETVRNFIFSGSKITPDGDCSHEIKRCLLLGRKAMTNLDSILKSIGLSSESYSFCSSVV